MLLEPITNFRAELVMRVLKAMKKFFDDHKKSIPPCVHSDKGCDLFQLGVMTAMAGGAGNEEQSSMADNFASFNDMVKKISAVKRRDLAYVHVHGYTRNSNPQITTHSSCDIQSKALVLIEKMEKTAELPAIPAHEQHFASFRNDSSGESII